MSQTVNEQMYDEELERPIYKQGFIVWATDYFKKRSGDRPWLILSNERYPYGESQRLCVPVTSTPDSRRISIKDTDLKLGDMKKDSYVSPWGVTQVRTEDMKEVEAVVADELVEQVAEELHYYTTRYVDNECGFVFDN